MKFQTPSRKVKSVDRAFELISCLQRLGGASLTELAEEMDLAKSTVHNYLVTLEDLGYVVNEGGTYRLGLRFLTHGIAARKLVGLEDLIHDHLSTVADDISYPTWWMCEEFGRGFFLDGKVPEGSDRIYGRVGRRSYLHTHALGKAILAERSNDQVREIVGRWGLPVRTERTTTDLETLLDDLRTIRNEGFAVSDGESALGVLSVGAGFRDKKGRIHAIGSFCFTREVHSTQIDELGQRLEEAATLIENQISVEEQ
jgi:IclR family acetate operon transcriptional repressor